MAMGVAYHRSTNPQYQGTIAVEGLRLTWLTNRLFGKEVVDGAL
jgi:hypothetical protein